MKIIYERSKLIDHKHSKLQKNKKKKNENNENYEQNHMYVVLLLFLFVCAPYFVAATTFTTLTFTACNEKPK